jgi:type IV secretory pathway VirB2 component (pilin)
MFRLLSLCIFTLLLLVGFQDAVFAQSVDPEQVVTENTDKMINILKGPIAKVLTAIILLAGVASLLRGRYKIALSCGVAFVVLLFLPLVVR